MATADGKMNQQDFIKALEEERRKIQMFPKELPLSLRLVSEAIENLRWITRGEDSIEGPVIEEFFPLRPCSSSGSQDSLPTDKGASDFKPDWLKSVQICDTVVPNEPQPCGEVSSEVIFPFFEKLDDLVDFRVKFQSTLRKPVAVYAKAGGAFHPFEKDKPVLPDTVSSGTATAIGGRRDDAEEVDREKEGHCLVAAQPTRKQRRCWSADLHRKFLNVLEQLGGSHVATPKQIKELMKVDGLTNDEVKSHLQKYRLHTRRPAATVQSSSSSSPPTPPQFVVVGGIWVPTPGYAAVAASSAAAAEPQQPEGSSAPLNRMNSPVASMPFESGLQEEQHNKNQLPNMTTTMPLHSQQKRSQHDDSSADDAASESNSSSTSFSHRITTSPLL